MPIQVTIAAILCIVFFLGATASYFLGIWKAFGALLVVAILALAAVIVKGSQNLHFIVLTYSSVVLPSLLLAAVLGSVLGRSIRKKRYLAGTLLALFFLFPFWMQYAENTAEKDERLHAASYVRDNRQLHALVGTSFQIYPVMESAYSRHEPGTKEFSIAGHKLYVVLRIDRSGDTPRFSIECVTNLDPGARLAGVPTCRQGTVPLPT